MNFSSLLPGLRQRVPGRKAPSFRFPLPEPARIALLETSFRRDHNMCECSVEDLPWLRIWAPEALVLPVGLAVTLANRKQHELFDLPSLNRAIVVLTSFDETPLASRHRDLLWSTFGVPVFEQLCGSDGTVIARECEIHDGLHFEAGKLHGVRGEIVTDHCACGSEMPRLRGREVVRKSARASAA